MQPRHPARIHSEPGARHDHLAHFGVGPGVTPVEDLTSSVFFVGLLIWLSIRMLGALPDIPADSMVWFLIVTVLCQLMLIAGTVYTTQRGIRRWRWRLANVHLTGGVYLRPWQKTPAALR